MECNQVTAHIFVTPPSDNKDRGENNAVPGSSVTLGWVTLSLDKERIGNVMMSRPASERHSGQEENLSVLRRPVITHTPADIRAPTSQSLISIAFDVLNIISCAITFSAVVHYCFVAMFAL